jgi:hypothetical protein
MRPNDAYSDDYRSRERRRGWDDDDWSERDRDRDDDYSYQRRSRGQLPYPTFCKVMFIMDICFCAFRLLMVPFGLLGLSMLQNQDPNNPLLKTVVFELSTNGAIGGLGLLAAILMLTRKKIGAVFGWLTVLSTLAGLGVALWQASIQMETQGFKPGTPQYAGAMVGIGLVLVLRLVLLGLYIAAIVKFMNLPARRARDYDRDW